MITATKVRIYPDTQQAEKLAKAFGCARWYWNDSLAKTQKIYQETGKGLGVKPEEENPLSLLVPMKLEAPAFRYGAIHYLQGIKRNDPTSMSGQPSSLALLLNLAAFCPGQ